MPSKKIVFVFISVAAALVILLSQRSIIKSGSQGLAWHSADFTRFFRPESITSLRSSSTSHRDRCFNRTSPTNIVFIKVHKSGSTTVANILARYAVAHDLNIALPDRQPGSGRYNYFRSLNRTNVKPVGVGQEYNVLFNHMIYNRKALDLLMPPDTFYCAIMRQPESRFLSAINYYGFLLPQDVRHYMHSIASANTTGSPGDSEAGNRTGSPNDSHTGNNTGSEGVSPALSPPGGGETGTLRRGTLANQSSDTSVASGRDLLSQVLTRMPGGGFASLLSIPANRKKMEVPEVYNSLVFDSGLPLAQHMNETAVTQHIAKLDRELDLMLVMEHFDESLVLLKRRACLQLKDIVHYKLNSRKSEPKHMITEADHQALRLWQMADHKTYDHFYKKFWSEIMKEGVNFTSELKHFRGVLNLVHDFCPSTRKDIDVLVIHSSPWNDEFTMNSHDCTLLQLKELAFQRILLERATRRQLQADKSSKRTQSTIKPVPHS